MAEYLTLVEAAKLTQDPLKKGVIEVFARTSPVLERLPLMDIAGQALVYNQEQTLPESGSVRSTPPTRRTWAWSTPRRKPLVVLGGSRQVDRALVKMQGNVNNLRAIHDSHESQSRSA